MKTVSLERVREVLENSLYLSHLSLDFIMRCLDKPEKETAIEALRAGKVIKYYSSIYRRTDGRAYFWDTNKWRPSQYFCCEQHRNSTDWEEVDDPSVPKFKRADGRMVENEREWQMKVVPECEVLKAIYDNGRYMADGDTIVLPHGDRRRTQ